MNLGKLKRLIIKEVRNLKEQGAGPRPSVPSKGPRVEGKNSTEFINNMVAYLESTGQTNLIPQAKAAKTAIDNPRHPRRKEACRGCGGSGQKLFCLFGSCVYGEDGRLKWNF
jgi:hypothetical protein